MSKPPQRRMTCPQVTIPVLQIPQPDGSILVKAGKPVVVEASISTREAARLLGMSPRWVMKECDLGRFKTAYKPGRQPTSQWRLLRTEVLARKKAEPA